jgi:two-component system, LytTR family, sensor histidine kinase LytS
MKFERFNSNAFLVENRWFWHVGFWLFYFIIRLRPYYNTVLFFDNLFLKYMLCVEILFIFTIYITLFLYNILIPMKKLFLFFGLGLLCWILYVVGDGFIKKNILGKLPNFSNYTRLDMFLDSISYYILFYFFLLLLKYFKDNYINQYNQNLVIKQQMAFELENLKAQISPHFLFNTMNNFYGLAVDNSKKLPSLMIQLSDLLRYSLYETKQEKVLLENEIKYLENYIELEKIRLEENLRLEFNVNNLHFEKYQIAPLLLITFLENAFKHSKNIHDEALFIQIKIDVTELGILNFLVKNNYNPNTENTIVSKKGIGLYNVKKRLDVIYPNSKHNLKIYNDAVFFTVELEINLM